MGDALAGRVVLVTGSSRGIGAEVAVKAASEGATVAVHYHTGADAAERTLARVREAGGDGATFEADLEDGDQAEGLVEPRHRALRAGRRAGQQRRPDPGRRRSSSSSRTSGTRSSRPT